MPANVDTDSDGLDNAYDPDNGGTVIALANTDGADQPDYLDADTDNDGIPDSIEGHDANADGIADRVRGNTDTDGDGLDDVYDTVASPAAGNAIGSNAPLQNFMDALVYTKPLFGREVANVGSAMRFFEEKRINFGFKNA